MAHSLGGEYHAFLALFKEMLEAAPDTTLVVDSAGRIVFANAATETALGWSPAALTGQSVECLVPATQRPEHVRQREEFAAKPLVRAMGKGRELVAVRCDGSNVPVEISLNPVPTEEGILTICVLRDVSVRKRIEQELRSLNLHLEERVVERTLELEAANRELEMLAYSIAHDLRAPLRAINSYSVQLEALESGLSGDAQRCLTLVKSRASQMSSMIDDYLHLLAVGRKELVVENLDMEALARQAATAVGLVSPKSVVIDSMPHVRGDRSLILEVWTQLLRNAVTFSAREKTPTVRAAAIQDGQFVYFSVTDNGVGFDPAYADKLFRLFERLHSAKDFAGNGIGLCLVKRIVERHGGGIEIESTLNKGARAMFWLPLAVM